MVRTPKNRVKIKVACLGPNQANTHCYGCTSKSMVMFQQKFLKPNIQAQTKIGMAIWKRIRSK